MIGEPIYPIGVLTVVIRDDAPMTHCGDSPTYRSVAIDLTPDQVSKIKLFPTSSSGGNVFHENVSKCFLEPGYCNHDALKLQLDAAAVPTDEVIRLRAALQGIVDDDPTVSLEDQRSRWDSRIEAARAALGCKA